MLALLLLAGCGRGNATPVPDTPSPTATTAFLNPAAATDEATEAVPKTTVPATAAEGETFTSERYGYSILLPCCWRALPLPTAMADSGLTGLGLDELGLGQPGNDDPGPAATGTSAPLGGVGQVLELLAILPRNEELGAPLAQLTVGVLPAVDLSLQGYLDATSAELERIGNTRVISSQLKDTYRQGNEMAAVIEYTAANMDENERIAGLQVALLMPEVENFVVLTFTTSIDQFDELLADFRRITRMVEL